MTTPPTRYCLLCGGPAHESTGCPMPTGVQDFLALQALYIERLADIQRLKAEAERLEAELAEKPDLGSFLIRVASTLGKRGGYVNPDTVLELARKIRAERDEARADFERAKPVLAMHNDLVAERDALRAQVSELESRQSLLAEALEVADEALAQIHDTNLWVHENEPDEWTERVNNLTNNAIDIARAALAKFKEPK